MIDEQNDKKEVLASLLLRLMAPKETQSKTVLMSILRHLEGGLNVLKPKTLSIDEDKHLILLRKGNVSKIKKNKNNKNVVQLCASIIVVSLY